MSGAADAILIPEIPFEMEKLCGFLEERYRTGPRYAIVVVAEGARSRGGDPSLVDDDADASPRYGGLAERVSREIGERTGIETRSLVLGHLQRGGQPTAYDRLLSLRFGAAAVDLVRQGSYGCMVALDPPVVRAVPLREAVDRIKSVPVDGDVVLTARRLGICFGD